jgi:hypothetical protein
VIIIIFSSISFTFFKSYLSCASREGATFSYLAGIFSYFFGLSTSLVAALGIVVVVVTFFGGASTGFYFFGGETSFFGIICPVPL